MEPERHDLQNGPEAISRGTATQAMKAYIGAGRSLVNNQTAFEYLTEEELEEGIALYYPAIYVPHARALSDKTISILKDYVEKGGHLIADVQFGFIDPYGKLRTPGPGKQLEQLFGAYPDMIHDARTGELKLNQIAIKGFYGEMKVTKARVAATFNNGMPAVTEHKLGKGKATFIAFDAGNETFKPGNTPCEALLDLLVRGNKAQEWSSTLAQTFRLSTPEADHYFFINDGEEKNVFLNVYDQTYKQGTYIIENKNIITEGTITVQVPKNSGVWVRLVK
jgi:beta-galactosidase